MGPSSIDGFEIGFHSSLSEPVTIAGVPRMIAVLNGALTAVPALGWQDAEAAILEQRLTPLWPLASETFTVVSAGPDIMSDRNKRSRRR